MVLDLTANALGVSLDLLRDHPRTRTGLAIASVLVLLTGLLLLGFAEILFTPEVSDAVKAAAPVFLGVSAVTLVLVLSSFSAVRISGGTITLELEGLRQEREEIQHRMAQTRRPDVLDTIQLSLNQLNEYYAINKSQARSSFRFSMFAIVTGFLAIIAGVWLFFLRPDPRIELTVITTTAGLITQFIGAAYFYLYRKSIVQLNLFFGELTRMQDTMLSVRLCDDFEDATKRAEMREMIIKRLMARSPTDFSSTMRVESDGKEALRKVEHHGGAS